MSQKSFPDFLTALLRFESAMDPAKIIPALKDPNARRNYFELHKDEHGHVIPGRLVRDKVTGKAIPKKDLTIEEYFTYLGLSEEYALLNRAIKAHESDKSLAALIDDAAYRCINYLGFVGFQVGEGVLIESGYYDAEKLPGDGEHKDQMFPAYYYWVDDESIFAHGNQYKEIKPEGFTKPLIATSYNMWHGDFTGLDGLTGPEGPRVPMEEKIAKLRTKDVQQRVIRAVMLSNLNTVVRLMAHKDEPARYTLDRILSTPFLVNGDQAGRVGAPLGEHVFPTISGLLAGAHLRGAAGLAADLKAGYPLRGDETGTTSYDYVKRFNGYQTPFDSPLEREFVFERSFPEVLEAGMGDVKAYISQPTGAHKEPLRVQVDLSNTRPTTIELDGFDPKAGDELRFLHRISVAEIKELTKNSANTVAKVDVHRDSSGSISKDTAVTSTDKGLAIKVGNVTVVFGRKSKAEVEKWVADGLFSFSVGYPFAWGEVGSNTNEPVYVAEDVFSVHAGDFFYPDPNNSGGLNLHSVSVSSLAASESSNSRGPLKDKAHIEVDEDFLHYGLIFSEKSERTLTKRNFVGFAGTPKGNGFRA